PRREAPNQSPYRPPGRCRGGALSTSSTCNSRPRRRGGTMTLTAERTRTRSAAERERTPRHARLASHWDRTDAAVRTGHDIRALRGRIAGEIALPGDPDWDA